MCDRQTGEEEERRVSYSSLCSAFAADEAFNPNPRHRHWGQVPCQVTTGKANVAHLKMTRNILLEVVQSNFRCSLFCIDLH